MSLHFIETAPGSVAKMLFKEGLGRRGKGNLGPSQDNTAPQLLTKGAGEKKQKGGGDDKISRDEEIWVGEDCLGIYPIIVEDSP